MDYSKYRQQQNRGTRKTTYRGRTTLGSNHKKKCNCKGGCKGESSGWPTQPTKDKYSHLLVGCGGDYNDIQSAMTAIHVTQSQKEGRKLYDKNGCSGLRDSEVSDFGYVLHLKEGQHTLYTSHVSDLEYLRIVGDPSPVKGVGYFHRVGNWEDYKTVNGDFDMCEGGQAPFTLSVNCDTIRVKGCSSSPNFNSLKCGDKVTYFQSGKMDCYYVKCANGNCITLDKPIKRKGKCAKKGEGFFIHPSVGLNMCARHCKTQKLYVEHRLEYAGLDLNLDNDFHTGAQGGHTEMEHSVVQGNCSTMYHKGIADWSKPNVFTTQLVSTGHSLGHFHLQSYVGCSANFTSNCNPNTEMWFGIFNGCLEGTTLKNTGKLSAFSTDFCSCTIGSNLLHGSSLNVTKARYMGCGLGIQVRHQGTVSGFPLFTKKSVCDEVPQFLENDVAIDVDFGHQSHFDTVFMSANGKDLVLDGTEYDQLSTYTSGTSGTNSSRFFYNKLLPDTP